MDLICLAFDDGGGDGPYDFAGSHNNMSSNSARAVPVEAFVVGMIYFQPDNEERDELSTWF